MNILGYRTLLVKHPDKPKKNIPVTRSWLGWLFKPKDFATQKEVEEFEKEWNLKNKTVSKFR